MKWWNEQRKDEMNNEMIKPPEGLSKSVKHNKWSCALACDEMNNEMIKWTKKLWNEQWNDEMNKEMM